MPEEEEDPFAVLLARDMGDEPPAEDAAPVEEAAPGETEAAAAADPAAAGAGDDRFAWLLEKLKDADPDAIRSELESVEAAASQEEHEARLDEMMAGTIQELTAALQSGAKSPEEVQEAYARERAVVTLQAENEDLKARLAQVERAATLEKVRAEFPGAPIQLLEHPALANADGNALRELAGLIHNHTTEAAKAGVSQYVAAKGKSSAFVPPTGKTAPLGAGMDDDDLTFEDIYGR